MPHVWMNRHLPVLALLVWMQTPLTSSPSEDVVLMKDGTTRAGKVAGLDEHYFRMMISLPSDQAGIRPVAVSLAIPRTDVQSITFAPQPGEGNLLKTATAQRIMEVDALWQKRRPWLSVQGSDAAEAGLVLGNLLLQSDSPDSALALFRLIEKESWQDTARASARQGRLQAMIATGQAGPAAAEARQLVESSHDPSLLIEANAVLAEAAAEALRKLEQENPRWKEDPFVRPERNRLFHEAIDRFLFPSLFFGWESQPSAQGLWRATEIFLQAGDIEAARQTASDLTELYPHTSYAGRVQTLSQLTSANQSTHEN